MPKSDFQSQFSTLKMIFILLTLLHTVPPVQSVNQFKLVQQKQITGDKGLSTVQIFIYILWVQGPSLKLVKASNLKYLELTKCQSENGIIQELLESCNVLQKLSLAWLSLENSVIQSVCSQNGQTLKVSLISVVEF